MRNNKSNTKKSQGGMTMIELLAVLAIAGIIVAGALIANAKGWVGNKAKQDITQLTSLVGETKKLQDVNGYGTSGTNLVTALVTQKSIPADMTQSGGALLNKYGGAVTVVSNGLGYTVTSAGYPSDACMEVSRALASAGSGISTKINGGSAISGNIASATAASSCSSDSNSVEWSFAN